MFEIKYQPKVDQCSLGAHSVPEDGASLKSGRGFSGGTYVGWKSDFKLTKSDRLKKLVCFLHRNLIFVFLPSYESEKS